MLITRECAGCSSTFSALPSRITKRKFCSTDCYVSDKRKPAVAEKASGFRLCTKCATRKKTSEFSPSAKGYLNRWCKPCKALSETARRKSPDAVKRHRELYESRMDFRAVHVLRSVGKRAKRSGVAFDLDADWLTERLSRGTCELTGLRFDMSIAGRKATAYTPSIDRCNPGAGYTKDNCRVILYALNHALSDHGLDGFLPIARALAARFD